MLYRKIDIFVNGRYVASTIQAKTQKEAKAKYLTANPWIEPTTVKTAKGER